MNACVKEVNQQFTEHNMGKIAPYHVHHIQYHLYNLHVAIYGKHTGPSQYPHCPLGNLKNKHNIYLQLQL